ncbi:helix-turn-helix transcriptional regulator [Thermoanaerobacterium sp. DL9XJH110]|uniref:helix-turn-helix transcriptional regulator n=1 Tax=Thermoanaerobacterium sp. DL9XJH110 TaxID=3386643 RepID=UPI003BB7FDBE
MANHITKLRKNAGFKTAKIAAKALGISSGMMYQMEGGHKKPSPELAIKMSSLFKCTLEDIFLPFNTTNSYKKDGLNQHLNKFIEIKSKNKERSAVNG